MTYAKTGITAKLVVGVVAVWADQLRSLRMASSLECDFVLTYHLKLYRWTKIPKRGSVASLLRSTLWPKSQNVTVSDSLHGPLYGPKNDILYKVNVMTKGRKISGYVAR